LVWDDRHIQMLDRVKQVPYIYGVSDSSVHKILKENKSLGESQLPHKEWLKGKRLHKWCWWEG